MLRYAVSEKQSKHFRKQSPETDGFHKPDCIDKKQKQEMSHSVIWFRRFRFRRERAMALYGVKPCPETEIYIKKFSNTKSAEFSFTK